MGYRPATVTQAELTRIAKAMIAAGVPEWRVVLDPATGKREIIAGPGAESAGANEWDEVLK